MTQTGQLPGSFRAAATVDEAEIRQLVSGETDLLAPPFTAVLPGSPTAQTHQLEEPEAFLRDPNSFALGAYIDETPVGLAWGIQMRSPSRRLTTYVHEPGMDEN